MTAIITVIARYLMIVLIAVYTLQSFTVFRKKTEAERQPVYKSQLVEMLLLHFIAYVVMYLHTHDLLLIFYYIAQITYLTATMIAFRMIYPKLSRLLMNHMYMLLLIGFIVLTRLDAEKSMKQFSIAALATFLSLLVPVIIRKARFLRNWTWVYCILGAGLLVAVAVLGSETFGSKINFTIGGVTFSPNEFVKIIFVFFVAAIYSKATTFKTVVLATVLAAAHILILVVYRDLGSALIYFVVYMSMMFIATKRFAYLFGGLLSFSGAACAAYFLFSHVRVRVLTWTTPFEIIKNDTSQLAQSLFAIGTGGFFGSGLYEGIPNTIPVAAADFIFSVICEELGTLFGICIILICLGCFVMFAKTALQTEDLFYKLVGFGLAVVFIFQVFLTIGGGTKFIPLTGVTLPLVSYGGTSLISSLILFAIMQGLYILNQDEGESNENVQKQIERSEKRA